MHHLSATQSNTSRQQMTVRVRNTIIFIALCVGGISATAQLPTYKCGNTYSQTPCTDGKTVNVDDSRTPLQKTQADADAARTGRIADKLEKERLQREAAGKATVMAPKAATTSANATQANGLGTQTSKKKSTKAKAEFFTAQSPGDPQKKPKASKSAKRSKAAADAKAAKANKTERAAEAATESRK